MQNRREFIRSATLGASMLSLAPSLCSGGGGGAGGQTPSTRQPSVAATWRHGLPANEKAWDVLTGGGSALDAAEAGVRVVEADPSSHSVGLGGYPDREGRVTLDACIMDGRGRCGSVAFLQDVVHAISVARLIMEKTPHVMLVGEGARQFALANGFTAQNLLTPEAEAAWQEWLVENRYEPRANWENRTLPDNHDTIGMVAQDSSGHLSGACSTSGMAFKMHGRVGDSPIIGAALYVDDSVGAACATGHGELVMRTLGSFLVVEKMRQGLSPAEACHQAMQRIVDREDDLQDMQVGYLALSKAGEVGAYSLRPGFDFAWHDGTQNRMLDSESWF